MPDQWRHMLELSIELEKLDDAGNYREGREPTRQRGRPQKQHRPSPPSPFIESRNHLARILDVIPGPPQEYQPKPSKLPVRQDTVPGLRQGYRPNNSRLPARQALLPAPHHYNPNTSRLPARQDEYIGRGYARQVTQVEVLPPPRGWRPPPIPERKTNEWRNYVLASCFGAVIGISGYTYLSQSGLRKGEAAKAPLPGIAVANATQRPRVAPDDAFRERVSNQLSRADVPSAGAGYSNQPYRGDVPGAGVGYGALAQSPAPSSGDALFERASNQLPPRDAPRAQAPYTAPQLSDDALLAQAFYKLGHGDVLGARAAYETAAQHGSSLGDFGLAETYDPNVLARRRSLGLKPDAGLARMWYERAAKLGSTEASQRLKKLTKLPRAVSLPKAVSSPNPVSSSQAISSGSEVLRR